MNEEYDTYESDDREHEASGMPLWSIALILIVVLALGYIVFDATKSETYFYTVDEALAVGTDLPGQKVRIKGIVEQGSVVGNPGELKREFRIAEKGLSIDVVYSRAMPDTFAEDMEVVVTGTVDKKMVLVAEEVLVKCPSRYEGEPPTAEEQSPRASLE